MIANFFKITLRNLARNKAFSFINIFGFAIGLATCLLIILYIYDESGYDKHHKDGDRIFRIASVSKGESWAALPGPVSAALKSELPEVQQTTRMMTFTDIEKMLIRYENGTEKKQFVELNGYYVDSTFLDVFTYEFVHGNMRTALNEPNSIVISDQMADKFFGKEDPVGRPLIINTPFGEFPYTVRGVFRTGSKKSHLPANYLLSMRNNDMWNWVKGQTNWGTNNIFFTYVKLNAGVDPKKFEKKLNVFFEKHAGAELKAAGFSKILFIQPIKDIYLHSSIGNEIAANGNITYLYILGSIAAFILIIACINFMNLSTARSERRAREVGVRKVVGAGRGSLIRQFLGESFVMCGMALALALLMVWLALPFFNSLTQKNIHATDKPGFILLIGGLTLLTGFLAGLYPAFYLSSFKPVLVLKGKLANSFSATTIRKGLVVFQFSISVGLMLGAVVIWKQLDFLKNQQLGFNKNQKIVIPLQMGFLNTEQNYTTLKNELLKNPEVKSVTSGSTYPGVANLSSMLFYAEGKTANESIDVRLSAVEKEFIETMGFHLRSGRSFLEHFTADSASIILNEAAIKELGYTADNAIGREVQFDFRGNRSSLRIVGVVSDFNFESLHTAIKPFGFMTRYFANRYGYTIADVSATDYSRLIQKISKSWSAINPSVPFTYSFLDQDFQRNYGKEQLTSRIVVSFTFIAILVACLGLFGLTAFAAGRRTREIGIRKALGASVINVTALLSRDFIKLVLVAIVIASPVAWFIMNRWLQGFAYKVNISWWIFAVTAVATVLIAFATVSFQAIKAAIASPAKGLRAE